MRLVDADYIKASVKRQCNNCRKEGMKWMSDIVERAIIEELDNTPIAQPQWIPCSERLPEEEGMYIVCFDRKQLRKNEYQIETSYWLDGKWQYGMLERYEYKMAEYVIEPVEYLTVIAWMPLPEPYGGESDGNN